jgi:hypothetical protein
MGECATCSKETIQEISELVEDFLQIYEDITCMNDLQKSMIARLKILNNKIKE